ncbi:hypothetical protein HAX54_046603 [Datura stramonium]|uniref:Secreted protein n=1 Tax=Datura stramonium TaxID=4076 RepID=A0ABS8WHB2_DATST|nr:hypothetical protein [Datura stramonium]
MNSTPFVMLNWLSSSLILTTMNLSSEGTRSSILGLAANLWFMAHHNFTVRPVRGSKGSTIGPQCGFNIDYLPVTLLNYSSGCSCSSAPSNVSLSVDHSRNPP